MRPCRILLDRRARGATDRAHHARHLIGSLGEIGTGRLELRNYATTLLQRMHELCDDSSDAWHIGGTHTHTDYLKSPLCRHHNTVRQPVRAAASSLPQWRLSVSLASCACQNAARGARGRDYCIRSNLRSLCWKRCLSQIIPWLRLRPGQAFNSTLIALQTRLASLSRVT